MIKILEESEGAVIGMEVSGKISSEQQKQIMDTLEQKIQEHGSISILSILGEHLQWGIDVGIDDIKWMITHLKQTNKIAIVSSSTVLQWLVTLDAPFGKMIGIEEKHFETKDLAKAWEWVKRGN